MPATSIEQEVKDVLAALNRAHDSCNCASGVESLRARQNGVRICVEWLNKHHVIYYFDEAFGGEYKLGMPKLF